MKFGPLPVDAAEGTILAHGQKLAEGRLAKGTRLSAADIAALGAVGATEVVVAQLAPGDLTEDEAAARLGGVVAGAHVSVGTAGTGRVNFFATADGLFVPDRGLVDRVNAVDPGITLATLGEYAPVEAGRMVATVKIIPLAVAGSAVENAADVVAGGPAFRVAPYRPQRVALIQTELPALKKSALDKTAKVLAARLARAGASLAGEQRCAHETLALAAAIGTVTDADLVIVFGASAVIDSADVIPAAVVAAGGKVRHLGMPVDPGNLLLLGEVAGRPLIGAPGCARSPKENGFDWILNRLLADVQVTPEDIRRMGVGGLLMEIATRPLPRERAAPIPKPPPMQRPIIDIALLAAGRSSRMGGPNKLLATFDGVPLIRRSAEVALASGARRVRVVVGHRREAIAAALIGLDVEIVENPAYAEGLATSVRAGAKAAFAAALPADGVMVMLADQPLLCAAHLDRLIAAFAPQGEGSIVVATDAGKRRNPVILAAGFAREIEELGGDVGARALLEAHEAEIRSVDLGPAAGVDVDTPEALQGAGGLLAG
ncbi:4-diphosphocytidyl-2C-methyl-D-erythritol kinase [Aureimonas sp. SA4125]|uniref:NTP transferase domain-containing protein n=1 Tax=Aureimonas sp. SA4125 TaxID=2826993 RepID=UPI001CC55047|nr:molybdopterin-binding/glycosyltransferase family 2 protein [Aureimonas sp. SA4125]BDA85045.1 4-diphosphocytidyl-2C-methyl-D-erythritol kinase [Aureimonas sp. SA4125]